MPPKISSGSHSRESSVQSTEKRDRLTGESPLSQFENIDDGKKVISTLVSILSELRKNKNKEYQSYHDSSLFIKSDLLEENDRKQLETLIGKKDKICLIRFEHEIITSELLPKLFKKYWDQFLEKNPTFKETIGYLPDQMIPTMEYKARLAISDLPPSTLTTSITNSASLIRHLDIQQNQVLIIGDSHSAKSALDVSNELVRRHNTEKFKFCFIEMLPSKYQPTIDKWMLEENTGENLGEYGTKLSQILEDKSSRGNQNMEFLQNLKERGIKPVAININLQTDQQFDTGGHQIEVRREGADVLFAELIHIILSDESDKTSLCFVGSDHSRGLKDLLEDKGVPSKVVNIYPTIQDHTSCLVTRDGSVQLYVNSKSGVAHLDTVIPHDILPKNTESAESSQGYGSDFESESEKSESEFDKVENALEALNKIITSRQEAGSIINSNIFIKDLNNAFEIRGINLGMDTIPETINDYDRAFIAISELQKVSRDEYSQENLKAILRNFTEDKVQQQLQQLRQTHTMGSR